MAFPGVEEFNMEFKVFKGALVNNNAPTASSTPLHLHLQVLRLGTHPQPQAKTRCQVRNTPPQPQAKVKRPNEVLRLGTHPQPQAKTRCQARNTHPQLQAK